MKNIIIIFLILAGNCLIVKGQQQNNIWFFGNSTNHSTDKSSYGLDFSGGGDPIIMGRVSGLSYYESVTVISDEDGNVLFYSDGIKIMDGDHNLMSGAPASLQGTQHGTTTASSVQGAFATKIPDQDSRYILFTTQAVEGSSGLRAHYIDLSLIGNGTIADPKGEVTAFDEPLFDDTGEMMTAYGVCGSDRVWIIAHERNSYNFVTVEVDATGIVNTSSQNVPMNVPGVSDLLSTTEWRGSMDINNEGDRLIYSAGGGGT